MWVEICRTAAFLPAGGAVGPHCQPRLSFPAPTVRCRCFPTDIWVTRLSGGRQAGRQRQQAEDTLRSTSNHHRIHTAMVPQTEKK